MSTAPELGKPKLKCPHCDAELSGNLASEVRDSTRLTLTITQEPGYRLSAGSLGGMLVNNEKLFAALARQHGTSLTVLVDDIRMVQDKTIIDFVLAVPARKPLTKKKKWA